MSTQHAARPPTSNRILNALSSAEYERLDSSLEPVELRAGDVLYHPDEPITHLYFPNRGTVSVVSVFAEGGMVEVGMVGNEGMFGVSVLLGSITSPLMAQVQLLGDALRIRADVLKQEFKKCGALHDIILRYTQAYIIQIAQGAACNRVHPIEGRVAKWLLMCQDRTHSSDLALTHEFIAQMLGIRRAGVTEAANQLKEAGLISYQRGHIRILDRAGLEAFSCECYPLVKKEFARLLASNGHAR